MAIAFDAQATGGAVSASPKTWSHTCASGAFLIVFVYANDLSDLISAVTYNGAAMTKLQTNLAVYAMTAWYLANPASGANTVSITSSGGTLSGRSLSYTGVLGGIDNSANGSSTSPVADTVTTICLLSTSD